MNHSNKISSPECVASRELFLHFRSYSPKKMIHFRRKQRSIMLFRQNFHNKRLHSNEMTSRLYSTSGIQMIRSIQSLFLDPGILQQYDPMKFEMCALPTLLPGKITMSDKLESLFC
ncbi:hypothetical protein SAMN04488689_106244 [Paenibacillus sp. cl6col]|nr:hypothetical protein SAMN04488689_106244 [Paenibacillus sp. cl6col]